MAACPIPVPGGMFTAVTLTRSEAGSYVDGRWVAGATSQQTITASMQPAKMKHEELLHLPDGDRNRSAVRIYTTSELRSANEQDHTPADFVTWDDEQWEVVKVDIWRLGLVHYKGLALRVGRQ